MPRPSSPRHHPALLLPAIVVGAGLTAFALGGFFTRASQADFTMFYDSGRAWNAGQSPYAAAHANLNPPSIVAAVFGPLARLPYPAAQSLWMLAGAAALAASLRDIARALALTRVQTLSLVAAMSVTYPWNLLWFGGQVSFVLMYPFTRAWLAYRAGRLEAAGAWLAPVVAFKPPFALLALLLPPRTWIVAGLGSAALSAASAAITGLQPWRDWFFFLGDITWLSWADNASLWGVAARARTGWLGGGSFDDVPGALRTGLVAAAIAGALYATRTRPPDRRIALALLWTLLANPLGWIYYAVLGAGPLRAMWNGGVWWWVALALASVPLPLVYPLVGGRWSVAVLGSVYAWSVIALWVAVVRTPRRQA